MSSMWNGWDKCMGRKRINCYSNFNKRGLIKIIVVKIIIIKMTIDLKNKWIVGYNCCMIIY